MKTPIFTPRITGLDSYGPGGWEWNVTDQDGKTTTYRTNKRGDGLWHEDIYDDRQDLGTCQFSLVGCTRRAAYGRIRRYFTEYMEG